MATGIFKSKVYRIGDVAQYMKLLPGTPASQTGDWMFHFLSRSLQLHLEEQLNKAQFLGSCTALGDVKEVPGSSLQLGPAHFNIVTL